MPVVTLRSAVSGDHALATTVTDETRVSEIRALALELNQTSDQKTLAFLTLNDRILDDDTVELRSLADGDAIEIVVLFRRVAQFSRTLSQNDDALPPPPSIDRPMAVVWSEDMRHVTVNEERHLVFVADEPCMPGRRSSLSIQVPRARGSVCLGVTPGSPNAFFREGNAGPMWFVDPYDRGIGVIAIDDGQPDYTFRARCLTMDESAASTPYGIVVEAADVGQQIQVVIDGDRKEISFYKSDFKVASVSIDGMTLPLYPAVWVTRPKLSITISIVPDLV